MNNRIKIAAIDLLYSKFGHFNDDFNSLSILFKDHQVDHMKFEKLNIFELINFLITIVKSYDVIYFASIKLSHAALIFPIIKLLQSRGIQLLLLIHFLPRNRTLSYKIIIPWLSHFCKIGVFSRSLRAEFLSKFNLKVTFIPSRIINTTEAVQYYHFKLSNNNRVLLIPGVGSAGKSLPPIEDLMQFLNKFEISKIIINSRININKTYISSINTGIQVEIHNGFINYHNYSKFFNQAQFVMCIFEKNYENRCSGIILDALKNGCVILTEDHPISREYGFPSIASIPLDSSKSSIKYSQNINIYSEALSDFSFLEAKSRWDDFIFAR